MTSEANKSEEKHREAIEVDLLQESDIPRTAEVYARAFNAASVDEHWTQQSAEEFIEYWYKRQPDLFFIAKDGDKVVGGAVAAIKPWCTGPKLTDGELFVSPDYQQKGLASMLSARRIEEAVNKYGVTEFEATADTDEIFPQQWYERIGLKKTRWAIFTGDASEILHKLGG